MDMCKNQIHIPGVGLCCNAYYNHHKKKGKLWMHFPFCKEENCPIKHPELFNKCQRKRIIRNVMEHDLYSLDKESIKYIIWNTEHRAFCDVYNIMIDGDEECYNMALRAIRRL